MKNDSTDEKIDYCVALCFFLTRCCLRKILYVLSRFNYSIFKVNMVACFKRDSYKIVCKRFLMFLKTKAFHVSCYFHIKLTVVQIITSAGIDY